MWKDCYCYCWWLRIFRLLIFHVWTQHIIFWNIIPNEHNSNHYLRKSSWCHHYNYVIISHDTIIRNISVIKQCATCIFKYQDRVDIAHTEHVRAKSSIYILCNTLLCIKWDGPSATEWIEFWGNNNNKTIKNLRLFQLFIMLSYLESESDHLSIII